MQSPVVRVPARCLAARNPPREAGRTHNGSQVGQVGPRSSEVAGGHILCPTLPRASLVSSPQSRHRLMTKESQFDKENQHRRMERPREALELRSAMGMAGAAKCQAVCRIIDVV